MNIQDADYNIVGMNRRFNFACDKCGKCCKNREDILLSSLDLYHLSKYLKENNTVETIRKYCECYIGQNSGLPVCLLKAVGHERRCPFLMRNMKCKIQDAKPSVCKLFPLGRMYNTETKEVTYFLNEVSCGRRGYSHSVGDWLQASHLLDGVDAFKALSRLQFAIYHFVHDPQNKEIISAPKFFEIMINLSFNYMTGQDYMEQVEEHLRNFEDLVAALKVKEK